jgi:hypothetical protein
VIVILTIVSTYILIILIGIDIHQKKTKPLLQLANFGYHRDVHMVIPANISTVFLQKESHLEYNGLKTMENGL